MTPQNILILQGHPDPAGGHWCQALAPGDASNPFNAKALGGRSVRLVVTRGMPSLIYRFCCYFRAHNLRSLERNILQFVGIAPVHESLVGRVDQLGAAGLARWQTKLRQWDRQAL